MNPAIEQLQARAIGAYTHLQPRERVIVVVGAAVLAVLIAYLGIWEPLVKAHHRNAEALEASRALAVSIEAAASLTQKSQGGANVRSEEHTSELQSLMRTSYAVLCLKKKNKHMITQLARLLN